MCRLEHIPMEEIRMKRLVANTNEFLIIERERKP